MRGSQVRVPWSQPVADPTPKRVPATTYQTGPAVDQDVRDSLDAMFGFGFTSPGAGISNVTWIGSLSAVVTTGVTLQLNGINFTGAVGDWWEMYQVQTTVVVATNPCTVQLELLNPGGSVIHTAGPMFLPVGTFPFTLGFNVVLNDPSGGVYFKRLKFIGIGGTSTVSRQTNSVVSTTSSDLRTDQDDYWQVAKTY